MFISTNCDHPVLFEVKIGRNAVEKSINILIYFFIVKMQRFLYAYLPLFLKGRHRWEFDLLPFPGTLSRPEKEYLYVCVFVMYVNKFILYSLKLYNFSLFRVYLRIVFLTVALHSLQTWIVISLCSWVRLIDWQGQIYDFVDVGGVVTWCYWYLGVVKSMGHTTKNASVCELEPNWKLLQGLLPKPESLNYAFLSQYKNMIGFC